MSKEKADFLTYKGRPLVRSKNTIYYGDMRESYVVMMQIVDYKNEGEMKVASHITLQMMNTDPNAPPTEMVIKRSEREGLYNALDLAAAWLDRQLGKAVS